MTDPVIELVKLDNGDIALRHLDEPDEVLLTIRFSEKIESLLQVDQMEVARAMVEAGMSSYRNIQVQRLQEVKAATEAGMLH